MEREIFSIYERLANIFGKDHVTGIGAQTPIDIVNNMNMERETPGLHKQMKELFRNEANWENKETFFLEGEKKNFNLKPEIGKVEEQRVPEK